jgi:isoleucyl-tRNA synthetase
MISFPIIGCDLGASLVAWTTTPWTLPSNLALCVNPGFTYVYARGPEGNVFVVAEARLCEIPGAAKKLKGGKRGSLADGWEVVKTVLGTDLDRLRYEPIFPFFEEELKDTAFRVCCDAYVSDDSGTGVVHQAPAYGEDDYRVCIANGVVTKGGSLPDPVDANGCFCHPVTEPFRGKHVKEADKDLIASIKNMVLSSHVLNRPNIFLIFLHGKMLALLSGSFDRQLSHCPFVSILLALSHTPDIQSSRIVFR